MRRQFGINQDVPVGDLISWTAREIIVSFIKQDAISCGGIFSNCLGKKSSVGTSTPTYMRFWELQQHEFRKFIGTGGIKLRPISPNKNRRLIPSKTVMGHVSRRNLTYTEVYSSGVECIVGHLKDNGGIDDSRI